jgi:hypothetical protein
VLYVPERFRYRLAGSAYSDRLTSRARHRGQARPRHANASCPLLSDEQRALKNRIDRKAVTAVRGEAARHRGEAERLESGRDELVIQATADYFAAPSDARVIAAGAGLLHHRASRGRRGVAPS